MKKLKILVADDEALIRLGLQKMLIRLGHEVLLASNGREACHLAELKPDCVLLDVRMPVMDGLEAAKIIGHEQSLPVILLTAHSDSDLIEQAARVPVQGYLVKPITEEKLSAEIQVVHASFTETSQHTAALEATAREVQQLKHEFLANTSHELRTPLAKILYSLELVMGGLIASPTDEHTLLRQAHSDSQHLLGQLNILLDMAQIEAGEARVYLELVELPPMIAQVESQLQPQAEQKKIQMEIQWPPQPLPPLRADPKRLKQILIHLLENAIKFTEKGKVTLGFRVLAERQQLQIEVQDTGIGIPPQKQARLFQPFAQVEGSYIRKHGGLGLGLSLSRRWAEMMGGSLTFDSTGEGQGSRFTLCLPLRL
jgi:signal transduction histidine kinase